jgi:hypothetical protein
MTGHRHHTTDTEAVALFHDVKSLQAAIDELLTSGFDQGCLSVLGNEKAIEDKLGHSYGSTRDSEDNPNVPRATWVPDESIVAEAASIGTPAYLSAIIGSLMVFASGGTLLGGVAIAAVAGGAGATVGTALAGIVGHEHAKHLNEQLNRGGLLLWVRTRDVEAEKKALDVLRRHSGQDVHLHPVPSAVADRGPTLDPGID